MVDQIASVVAPSFEVTFDDDAHVLIVELSGFWSLATLALFTANVMKVAIAARLRHGAYDVLCDLSRFSVQSQKVAQTFRTFVNATPIVNDGKIAVVFVSALVGAQIRRDAPIASIRYFTSMEEAKDWLAAPE